MKKVLLLGALLSTMAFGEVEQDNKQATINFTGKAIGVLTIEGGADVNFGTVVVGKDVTSSSTVTLKGEEKQNIKLTISTISEISTGTVVAYFDNNEGTKEKVVQIAEGNGTVGQQETVNFKYTANASGEFTGTATITAIYTE